MNFVKGEDSVIECVADKSGSFGVFMSWNSGDYTNKRLVRINNY